MRNPNMTLDGVNNKRLPNLNEIPEFKFSEADAKEAEKRINIFMKDAKFIPLEGDKTVKLVDVGKDGKIVYENNEGSVFTAKNQQDLAAQTAKDGFKMSGFLDGFFNKSKSVFS